MKIKLNVTHTGKIFLCSVDGVHERDFQRAPKR